MPTNSTTIPTFTRLFAAETFFRTEDAEHTWCTGCYGSENVEAAGATKKLVLTRKRDTSRRVRTVLCNGYKSWLHEVRLSL